MANVDRELLERVAGRFGPEYKEEVRKIDPSRSFDTLRDILSLGSDVIGVAAGIYYVVSYLLSRAGSARTEAVQALRSQIEALPSSKRDIGNKIIDAAQDELSKK